MRIDGEVLKALEGQVSGSTHGDYLEVIAWRGGEPVTEALDVTEWSLLWDAGRQVQGLATLTVADPDGELGAWSLADKLGAGGSRLHITWVSGTDGLRVPLGIWRIRSSPPRETWRVFKREDGSIERTPGGGSVTITADEDATSTAVLERMDGEEVSSATCLAAVTRLMDDIAAVAVDPAVVDKAVPSTTVYDRDRMDAIEDLLEIVGAVHRCGPDGSLQVIPESGVGPVWEIAGTRDKDGNDEGVLIDHKRDLSDAGVYNGVISTSKTEDGKPLVGRAYLQSGPLAWGGPYGRRPMWHETDATTQLGVDRDAANMLANQAATAEVELAVTCLTHPGIQLQDLVTVVAPTTAGDAPLVGKVVGMEMRSATSDAGTTPAKAMTLRVAVPVDALEAVAARVRRAQR